MKKDIVVPELGESITQGILVEWLKKTGDTVAEGDELFELETDKATLAVPSTASGLLKTLVEEGDEVQVGQIVAEVDSDGASADDVSTGNDSSTTLPEEEDGKLVEEKSLPPEPSISDPSEPTDAALKGHEALSPAVRHLLSEHDLDPEQIVGTGKEGRLTKADVLAHIKENEQPTKDRPQQDVVAQTPLPNAEKKEQAPPKQRQPTKAAVETLSDENNRQRRVPMPTIRRRTAERLVKAQQDAAFLTTFNEVNMNNIMNLRNRYKDSFEKKHGIKLGFMSFFVKASCSALQNFPAVNAMIDGEDIVYNNYYDIGIAVSTDRGLVVPVIKSADMLSFSEIEKRIVDFGDRARRKRLTLDELMGGTFTISNGGVFGSLLSTPIPNPPQTAILGLHAIQKRAVVIDDTIVIQPMMYLALSYDHRLIDGKEAVTFLKHIRDLVENPERIMLEV